MGLIERFGRSVPAGQVLFREGDAGREMFVIQAGKVRILRTIRGNDKVLAELGPGEFFGEMSLINDRPRTATALVIEDAQMLVLDPRTFEAMIRANTEIAVRMIRKLARRLDEANAQIDNLLLGDADSRVVHALLQLCSGAEAAGSGVLLRTSPVEVAERTRSDEASAREIFMRLERSKLVVPHPHGYVVPDVSKLSEFLELLEMRERFGEV